MDEPESERTCARCGRRLEREEPFELDRTGYTRCRACAAGSEADDAHAESPRARETQMPAGTTWTSTVPIRSGWYRWRKDHEGAMECVLVDAGSARAWRCGDATVYALDPGHGGGREIGGEWWPRPIEEPR